MAKSTVKEISLPEFIRIRRKAQKMTLEDFAQALSQRVFSYAASSVAHWESTKSPSNPPIHDPDFLAAFSAVLGTTAHRVYEIAGIIPPAGGKSEYNDFWALLERLSPRQREGLKFIIEQIAPEG